MKKMMILGLAAAGLLAVVAFAGEGESDKVEGDPMVRITSLPFDGDKKAILTAVSADVSKATGLPETFVTYYWQTFDAVYCPGCEGVGISTVVFVDLYVPAFMSSDERGQVMEALGDAMEKNSPFSKKELYIHTHIGQKDQIYISGGPVTNWSQVGGPDE